MKDAYKTIAHPTLGEFRDRGSKFIAQLFPMSSELTFAEWMSKSKTEHPKSRHHCYAYRLNNGIERLSDDGEPSGSAGRPIMNRLYSAEIVDVGCIVVRYFGGTKLGVPGLINAYKSVTQDALTKVDVVQRYLTEEIQVSFDYAQMGRLMDVLKQLGLVVSKTDLGLHPTLAYEARLSQSADSIRKIKAKMLGRSLDDIEDDTMVPGVRFPDH